MDQKTIKLSVENYRWLAKLAADLQKKKGIPISFDEAVSELKSKRSSRNGLLSVAGRWNMSDKEAERFEKETRTLWKTWKL